MQLAARVLAATAWDLYKNPQTLAAARTELVRRLGGRTYQSLMEPGQKPPLDYRDKARPRLPQREAP
jgi:aminobenzoyl-glutamate utilization protein B